MKLESTLEAYGLSDKQAKVYLATLELGTATAQKISQVSGLARTTCYEILETLKPLGLISVVEKRRIKYFEASDPHMLARQSKEKAELLEKALPQFLALYGEARERPTVKFYQGKEAMKEVLKEILDEARELISISSTEDLSSVLGEYFEKFIKKRVQKKIMSRVIMRNSPEAQYRLKTGPEELREVRLLPQEFIYHSVVFIWNSKVAIFSPKQEENFVLIIESEEIAQYHRAMFEFMWQTLGNC